MSWNYRILEVENGGFGLCEVYYHGNTKKIWGWTDPIVYGDTPEEIISSLGMMMSDAEKPIIKLSDRYEGTE
jgi:hypothetical protein